LLITTTVSSRPHCKESNYVQLHCYIEGWLLYDCASK
jgi:hypothetical protein